MSLKKYLKLYRSSSNIDSYKVKMLISMVIFVKIYVDKYYMYVDKNKTVYK